VRQLHTKTEAEEVTVGNELNISLQSRYLITVIQDSGM
jgi:hypothetical protein